MDAVAAPSQFRSARLWRLFRVDTERRSPLVMMLAATICGLGLAASGITLVRAADDAGVLRFFANEYVVRMTQAVRIRPPVAPGRRQTVSARSRKVAAFRTGSDRRNKTAARRAATSATLASVGPATRRTVCVRECDGYAFPVGTLGRAGDLPAHSSACSSSCPGAKTSLYTLAPGQGLDDLGRARSVQDGSLYRGLKTAFLFRTKLPEACSCQNGDTIASHLPILLDRTLRSGDVVVDKNGAAKVYAGAGQIPHKPTSFADYRSSRALNRSAAAQVDRLMGTSQREAASRAFERSLRIREASLRQIPSPAGSAAGVRVYQVTADAGRLDISGARIISLP